MAINYGQQQWGEDTFEDTAPAISDQDIFNWFLANPTANDATIAATMNEFGLNPADIARATGTNVADVQTRYDTALGLGSLPGAAVTADVSTTPAVVTTPAVTTATTGADTTTATTGADTTTATTATTGATTGNVLTGNILAGASWNSTNTDLANQLTTLTGQNTLNTAVGGATTADTLNQLTTFLDGGGSFDEDATVFLQTGGVDFLQGVDRATITNNIDQIVSLLADQGVDVVLTGSPYAASVNDVVTNNFNAQIDSLYSDIAAKHDNVELVDVMGDILQDKTLLKDPLHTNDEGTARYNAAVIAAYQELIARGASPAEAKVAAKEIAEQTSTQTDSEDDAAAAATAAVTKGADTATDTTAAVDLSKATDLKNGTFLTTTGAIVNAEGNTVKDTGSAATATLTSQIL